MLARTVRLIEGVEALLNNDLFSRESRQDLLTVWRWIQGAELVKHDSKCFGLSNEV